jgi:hypothetical protein
MIFIIKETTLPGGMKERKISYLLLAREVMLLSFQSGQESTTLLLSPI